MKKWVRLVCVFLCVLLIGGCAAPSPGGESSPASALLTVSDAETVVKNNLPQVGYELYVEFQSEQTIEDRAYYYFLVYSLGSEPLMGDQGSYYQQFTYAWAYVDALTGELYEMPASGEGLRPWLGQSPDDFDVLVADNPIDKAYDAAIQKGDEVFETIAVTYCDTWKEEFRLTKEHISEFVGEEQSQELMNDLTSWETIVMNHYRWIMVNIHNDSRFSSPFGAQGYLEEYVHLAREYRYKTLWLKRIFFMKKLEKSFDQNEEQELPVPSVEWYSQL